MGLPTFVKRAVVLASLLPLGIAVAVPTAGAADADPVRVPLPDPATGGSGWPTRLRRARVLAVTTLLVVAAVAVAMPATAEADTPGPTTAGAANAGPENIPIPSDVAGCPSGNYVATNPGSQQTTVFLLVPPGGPANCPGPLDATFNPGQQSPADQAVALPLTASSCQAGTQLLDNELAALGQAPIGTVGSGPPPSSGSPCPLGDAALTQLQTAITIIPPTLDANTVLTTQFSLIELLVVLLIIGILLANAIPTFLSVTKTAGDTAAQANLQTALTGAYTTDLHDTPAGGFFLAPHGLQPGIYRLLPSGTAGVASVVCVFCSR